MKYKIVIITIVMLLINHVHAQGMPGVKKVYSYNAHSIFGRPFTYKLYFILSKELTLINDRFYNTLVLGEDSTFKFGYVRYDSFAKQIYYLGIHYERNGVNDSIYNKEQRFISFFNDTVNFTASLDGKIISSVQNDTVFVIKLLSESEPSDTILLNELIFLKGELYPRSVVIYDPMLDKKIVLRGD